MSNTSTGLSVLTSEIEATTQAVVKRVLNSIDRASARLEAEQQLEDEQALADTEIALVQVRLSKAAALLAAAQAHRAKLTSEVETCRPRQVAGEQPRELTGEAEDTAADTDAEEPRHHRPQAPGELAGRPQPAGRDQRSEVARTRPHSGRRGAGTLSLNPEEWICSACCSTTSPRVPGSRTPRAACASVAVRTSLSVWVLKNDSIPHNLLARMTAAGVRWHLVPFEAAAAQSILAMTTEALAQEVRKIESSLARSLQRTGDRFEAGEANRRQCMAATRAALARAQQALRSARAVEALFGIDAGSTGTEAAVARLGLAARQRAETYAALTAEVGEHDAALADAAEADLVPAGVLADRIEDATGRDMEAVHTSFREAV